MQVFLIESHKLMQKHSKSNCAEQFHLRIPSWLIIIDQSLNLFGGMQDHIAHEHHSSSCSWRKQIIQTHINQGPCLSSILKCCCTKNQTRGGVGAVLYEFCMIFGVQILAHWGDISPKKSILLMLFSVSSLSIFDDVSDEEYLVLIYLPKRGKLQGSSREDIESA